MIDKFTLFLKLIKDQKLTVQNALMVLVTAAMLETYQYLAFRCPCSPGLNLPYSLISVVFPAILILVLGFSMTRRTWRLATGCCYRGEQGNRNRQDLSGKGMVHVLCSLSAQALLGPFTWIAVALLDGTYYTCAAVEFYRIGSQIPQRDNATVLAWLASMPCGNLSKATPASVRDLQTAVLRELVAHSQLMGWVLVGIVGIATFAVACCRITRSPVGFMQLEYWKAYIEAEQEAFEEATKEHVQELATSNAQKFFTSGVDPSKGFIEPTSESWDAVTHLYTFSPENFYYSVLHEWAASPGKHGSGAGSICETLTFVDGRLPPRQRMDPSDVEELEVLIDENTGREAEEEQKIGSRVLKLTWIRSTSHSNPPQTTVDPDIFNAVNKPW
uniref:calcium homeostasis modulator protein 6-like n=1 Tax=Myxine glutinosa TaxID=7769 RepID=UPI00358E3C48